MIDDKCQLWWLVWCGGSIRPRSRLARERWLPHLNTACPSNLNSHSSILDRNLDVILHDQTDIYDCLTVSSLYVYPCNAIQCIGLCFERRQLELNLYYQEVITTTVPGIALSENLLTGQLSSQLLLFKREQKVEQPPSHTISQSSIIDAIAAISETMNDSLTEQMTGVTARRCYRV